MLRFCIILKDIKRFINLYIFNFINFIVILLGRGELSKASCFKNIPVFIYLIIHLTIADYVVAGANLRAFNYGLPPNRDRAWIKSIVDGVTVPTFVPKSGVKIAVTDAEAQAQSNQDSTMGDDQSLEGMVEELKAGH